MFRKKMSLGLTLSLMLMWLLVGLFLPDSKVEARVFLTTTPTATNTPGPISLIAPADQSHTTDTTPHFYWTNAGMATYAVYVVSLDGSFSVDWGCTGCSDLEAQSPLPIGTYLWHVESSFGPSNETFTLLIDADSTATDTPTFTPSDTSTPDTLTPTPTSTPGPISLIAPADQSHTTDTTPHFFWTNAGMAHYAVYVVSLDNSFSVNWGCTGCSDLEAQSPLPVGTYLWHVESSLGASNETFTLFIDDEPTITPTPTNTAIPRPPAPTNVLPTHRSHTTDHTPTFQWSKVAGADMYRLQVYTEDLTYDVKVRTIGMNATTYTWHENLAVGKYLWRTRDRNGTTQVWSMYSSRFTLFVD